MAGTGSVLLVTAPFLSVLRPAAGVSALKASLHRAGVAVSASYLNLEFAASIGVDLSEIVSEKLPNHRLIGEWIFAEVLFGRRDDPLYAEYETWLSEYVGDELYRRLQTARGLARTFVLDAARCLVAKKPAIIGFSSSFQQNCASLALAAQVRRWAPEVIICFGGANCEDRMGLGLLKAFPQIDYVFSGEADLLFPRFVAEVLAGKTPTISDALFSRNQLVMGDSVQPIFDLDSLPTPDFHDYFDALSQMSYGDRIRPGLSIETSRGCWWGAKKHCRFCGLNGKAITYRAKSPKRVLEEVSALEKRYKISRFEATDNIMSMKHVDAVFSELGKNDRHPTFFYEVKSNLTSEQIKCLARGGVRWIQPGIESLDDEVLKLMNKGVTGLQNVRLLRSCAEVGIRCIWNLLHGFPGERARSYQRIAEAIPLLEHLEPPNGTSPVRVDRFSPYYQQSEELGFRNVRVSQVYRAVYDLPEYCLRDICYYFDAEPALEDKEDYIAPVRNAVARWRYRAYEAPHSPELKLLRIGKGLALVNDTRSCAKDDCRVLEPEEGVLLNAFREPVAIDQTLAALQDRADADGLSEGLERLIDLGYILRDGSRAISIVTETEHRVCDTPDPSEFPGGWLDPDPTPALPRPPALDLA